jgi:ATP-dependent DNA helicase RecG
MGVDVPGTTPPQRDGSPNGSEKSSERGSEIMPEKTSEKTSEKILRAIRANPEATIAERADTAGVTTRSVERNIKNLQNAGKLRRIGPDRGGHWEVIE